MNKFFIYFIFLIFIFCSNVFSFEGECYFEEVYKNGEVQNGFFIISNNNIRYEYFDKKLFTIVYLDDVFYLIENKNKNNTEVIKDKRVEFFKNIVELLQNYPNIDNLMKVNNYEIIIDKGTNPYLPKRLAIKSNTINLNIYLNECTYKPINKLFFNVNPLFEYNLK